MVRVPNYYRERGKLDKLRELVEEEKLTLRVAATLPAEQAGSVQRRARPRDVPTGPGGPPRRRLTGTVVHRAMRAAWYERQGPAAEVLRVGELATPSPGPGEVRVRVHLSGVNPGDVKKRSGIEGALMPFPLVVPHSDGSGVLDAVGDGVDPARIGSRVWTYGAQSYRPFGTAAQYTVVPDHLAVDLPDEVAYEIGAGLGIPGLTAHRAVFADGPVSGTIVLVHGVLGGVGSIAAQLASWAGANVIGTVRRHDDAAKVDSRVASDVVALDGADPVSAIRVFAPDGVDRIIEVAFSENVDLDAAVAKNGTVIAAYATRQARPNFPFWPMLFDNITIRLLGSDDFPATSKRQAATDLTAAARHGAVTIDIDEVLPLARIAEAHERVEAGAHGRILIRIPE